MGGPWRCFRGSDTAQSTLLSYMKPPRLCTNRGFWPFWEPGCWVQGERGSGRAGLPHPPEWRRQWRPARWRALRACPTHGHARSRSSGTWSTQSYVHGLTGGRQERKSSKCGLKWKKTEIKSNVCEKWKWKVEACCHGLQNVLLKHAEKTQA